MNKFKKARMVNPVKDGDYMSNDVVNLVYFNIERPLKDIIMPIREMYFGTETEWVPMTWMLGTYEQI